MCNKLFQFFGISTGEAILLFAPLDKEEGGHAGNVVAFSQLFAFVNVYLQYDNFILVGFGKFLQFGGNDFAGTTPGGKKVNDNQFIAGLFELLIEIGLEKNYQKIMGHHKLMRNARNNLSRPEKNFAKLVVVYNNASKDNIFYHNLFTHS